MFACEWGVFIDGEAEPHPCGVSIWLCLTNGYSFSCLHEVIEFLPVRVTLPVEFVEFFELDDSVGGADFIGFEVVSDTVKNEDHVVGGSISEFAEVSGFIFT